MEKKIMSCIMVAVISLCACRGSKADESYVTEIGAATWRLGTKDGVNLYLLAGKERALLIDTGNGDFDIPGAIARVTDLPVTVVNTHGHPDHSGGNRFFPAVGGSEDDASMIRYFSNAPRGKPSVGTLVDDQVIDLGSRSVRVIATPGHTAGSLCFLDSANAMLFTGDTSNVMTWMFLGDATTLETYASSLGKLALVVGSPVTLFPGHGTAMDETLIAKLRRCAEAILSGGRGEPYRVSAGKGLNFSLDGVSIVYDPERTR